MTLFLNAHSDRLAPGSFQQPVPIPASQPGAPDLVQVCFNKDWLPLILGSLFQLTLSTTWQATSQTELLDGLQKANDLILIFQLAKPGCAVIDTGPDGIGDCDMCCCLRMQDGILQILSCGVWTDVPGWSKSEIAPGQPGTGALQPPIGGCQIYQGKITPTEPWLVPTPVSAGDTIEISNLIGAWSPSAFTEIWDCPDGNLYFAGNCIDGTSSIDAGAPDPTAPLNGTLVFDGTNYYDVSGAANIDTPITITILPGVSTAQALVRCNFHGGVDPSGEVTFTAKVCNNAVPSWSHTYDFASSPGPFSVKPVTGGTGSNGTWSPGVGFKPGDFDDGPHVETFHRIDLICAFTRAAQIDTVSMLFDLTVSTFVSGAEDAEAIFTVNGGTHTIVAVTASGAVTGTNQTLSGGPSPAAQTSMELYLASGTCLGSCSPGGDATLKSITITGHGPDPFVP